MFRILFLCEAPSKSALSRPPEHNLSKMTRLGLTRRLQRFQAFLHIAKNSQTRLYVFFTMYKIILGKIARFEATQKESAAPLFAAV